MMHAQCPLPVYYSQIAHGSKTSITLSEVASYPAVSGQWPHGQGDHWSIVLLFGYHVFTVSHILINRSCPWGPNIRNFQKIFKGEMLITIITLLHISCEFTINSQVIFISILG